VRVAEPDPPLIDVAAIHGLTDHLRGRAQQAVLEPDALGILRAMGIAVPPSVFVPVVGGNEIDQDAIDEAVFGLDGEHVVVRVVAPAIAHKTEVGGVAVVARDASALLASINSMRDRLAGRDVAGFVVAGFVEHAAGLGGSLLVSARWTPDLGPVVSVGAGGIDAEAVAADLRSGREVVILSPSLTPRDAIPDLLRASTAVRLATEGRRGLSPPLPMARLVDVVARFLALADACIPADVLELEVNPIVVTPGGELVALDVLVVPGTGRDVVAQAVAEGAAPPRPVSKLPRMLEPRSIAIIGVSSGMNAGHVILRNLLRDGFEPAAVTVIKPGVDAIDGCSCVPDVAALATSVDLFVVAVAAAQAAEVVADVVDRDAAETILVIPGGFEEKSGTGAIVARMRTAIAAARDRPDGGPLLNGGNCLGFRSLPGRIDTTFIPVSKLAGPGSGAAVPLAIVAQSGAFAITRLGRLADLHPRYLVTVGNQMDLTVADHLAHLANDPGVSVFGVYVEGFRPLDAARFLEAARTIRARGGTVVLYRAGRTSAGAAASASHTASIAGDTVAVRALARQAGVLVADTLEEFDDLVRAATLLVGREIGGRRLGAISNAGFECVAIGDNLGSLELVPFDGPTAERLGRALAGAGAGGVVDVHNPLDATPVADDAAFAALAETILAAPGVDVGVVGIVPLTAALRTLPPGPDHAEDLAAADAIASLLVDLWRRTTRAWVAIVDGGPLYDPFVAVLEAGGIPVFRTADRAMRALDAVVRDRLAAPVTAPP
jgi:acyl-CoA synthetase (NDP forming)